MAKKEAKKYKVLGSIKGSGTTYSCLYSTVKTPGVRYSTVKDRAKSLALLARRKQKARVK
ncbi:MAG: hypothetical protein AB1485_07930 [Candidatus Thermoplasmatota archaeon]